MFDRFDIPKSLKSATRHLPLSDSYPVAYHSTDTSNISLRKLLSNTATKDELTVFLCKRIVGILKREQVVYCFMAKIVSEYDQEIPQSQTADNPVAPRGRAAQPSRDTRKIN